jgi:hypothetical protein
MLGAHAPSPAVQRTRVGRFAPPAVSCTAQRRARWHQPSPRFDAESLCAATAGTQPTAHRGVRRPAEGLARSPCHTKRHAQLRAAARVCARHQQGRLARPVPPHQRSQRSPATAPTMQKQREPPAGRRAQQQLATHTPGPPPLCCQRGALVMMRRRHHACRRARGSPRTCCASSNRWGACGCGAVGGMQARAHTAACCSCLHERRKNAGTCTHSSHAGTCTHSNLRLAMPTAHTRVLAGACSSRGAAAARGSGTRSCRGLRGSTVSC